MSQHTYRKGLQGANFRVEVAYVAPPRVTLAPPSPEENPPTGPLVVKEPLMIETDVLGYPVGTAVSLAVYEPHKLHEQPVFEASASTGEETRGVSVEWTFDWEAHKETLAGARFVCVARVGALTSISEPFEILDTFTRELQDSAGKPIPGALVRLRAPRRADIRAETDSEGKLDLRVPPGDYLVEVVGRALG